MNKPIFIAEIKTKSMFGFESKYCRGILIDTAIEHGDWISVHTDPRFGGSFDDIYQIRKETDKPILAKGFHTHGDDVQRCFDLGADYVLAVDVYHPGFLLERMLYEVSSLNSEIQWNNIAFSPISNKITNAKFVYNGRDLKTGIGKMKINNGKIQPAGYQEYRKKFNWLCGASLIEKPEDIDKYYPDCDAFIIGENLMRFCRLL